MKLSSLLLCVALGLLGCDDAEPASSADSQPLADAASFDAGPVDARFREDRSLPDATSPDTGMPDTGMLDAAAPDAATLDAAAPDAAAPDAAAPDAAAPDAAAPDAAAPDAAAPSDLCAEWAAVDDGILSNSLHTRLSVDYRPIDPERDLGGNVNRYTTARHMMFVQVDRFSPGQGEPAGVEGIYTGRFVALGPDEEPDNGDMNTEHVWPRSRLDPDRHGILYAHQQSDLHQIQPADSNTNSTRGSLRFGVVAFDRNLDNLPAISGQDASGDRVFEPRDERKGDIARIVFYMSTRWGLDISAAEEDVLRRWHLTDPVAARERSRNDVVERLQGNRNPYIDCPQLIDRIPQFDLFPIRDTPESLPFP